MGFRVRVKSLPIGLVILMMAYQNCTPFKAAAFGQSVELSSLSPLFGIQCDQAADIHAVRGGTLSWHANKGTEAAPIPVDGTMAFDAVFYQPAGSLDHEVKLIFHLRSIATGVAIRDQRIGNVLFGLADGFGLEFRATVPAADVSVIESLADGQTQTVSLSGQLTLWGVSVPLTVPIEVKRAGESFTAGSSAGTGFVIGILSQLGLQDKVTQLSAICGATPLDSVKTEFTFDLNKPCK